MAARPLIPSICSVRNRRPNRARKRTSLSEKQPGRPGLRLVLKFLEKPGAGVSPEKIGAASRDAEGLGGFPDREPREVAKLDQFSGLGISRGKFRQGLVQRQYLVVFSSCF